MASSERLSYKLNKKNERIYGDPKVQYLYNMEQATAFCECSHDTIRSWVKRGILPAYREMRDPEKDPLTAYQGRLFFLLDDLKDALRIGLRVPTKGFNVEDRTRNSNAY